MEKMWKNELACEIEEPTYTRTSKVPVMWTYALFHLLSSPAR